MSNEATMPRDISDREDFYKDSSNKHRKSSGNKSFCELLSLSYYQGSAATIPSGRDNKSGWYDIHQKHVNLSLNSKTILVLIGDSIVAGLSRYANIWRTFFKTFHTLNYGIGGDRTQHVLWRAENVTLPNSLKYVVIHCGTNNIDRDQPRDIANGVISIGLKLQEKCRGLKVIVTGLLPRDSEWSQRRKKINLINYYLEKLCCDRFDDFYFMKQDDDWTDEDGKLDKKLYYADQLHLVEAGNRKFACSILKILSKLMQDEKLGNSSDVRKAHYLFEFNSDVNHCKPVSHSNTILDGTLPVAFMAGVRIDYWQERSMSVFDTPKEDTESSDYIFRNYIILTLSYFFGNIFCKNKIINTTRLLLSIFIIFVSVYKFPSNQSDSDLKYCSKFEFYHAESVKLQDNLGIINRNTNLAFFAISKLRNKPAHFLKFYQILLILSGDISLNPGPCQTQLNDDKTWDPLKTKGLHLCHLNVNSLLSKIDEIRDIANRVKPAVLGITESKLDSSVTNMEVNINGYSIIRNDRNRHGGGVACYVKNDLCFNTKKIFPNSIEHVFFEILIPKVKPIAVGIFYRPPNSNDFLDLLSNSFQQIDLNKKEIYLLGDFNINLFQNGKFLLKENQSNQVKDTTCSLISKYKEFCQSFFLTEIIKEPTRTTCNTASLLDHILTNCAEKVSQKGVIDVGLSDHQLIFCTRKIRRTRHNMHNQIQTRSLRNYSAEKLISTLKDIKFPNYDIFSDVNVAYADLTKKISDAIDNVAPIKTLRIKNNSQDWFDSEIAEAIKLREKYFKKFKKSNLHIDYDFYIEAKYNVQKLIKQKKIEFYNAKLTENIGKPKELWRALKNLGLPSKKSPSTNICLTKDNTTIFADKENTNIFKKFYSTLADDLVKNLPPASSIFGLSSVCQYYNKTLKLPNTRFKFTFVSEDSVLKILKNMDENKAAGLDNLSGKFLRDGATILAKPLSEICNLSIKYSTFPNDCKIAKLKPLFKRGSKTDPKNYRPISLLPLISKIIEKIIHDQTQNFLDKNNVIYRYQSGFRKFYSTDSCLSYLNNKITTGFESGLFTGMILIDLQKAFDTINHDILIKKMTFLGFSEETTNWFKSYLTNRKFIVHINNSFSEPGNLLCGVPQGSILGPLLFLLYINDMPQAVTCDLLLYADDTCLVFQHKDVIEIETVLNKNFSSLCDWFIDNKLSIHFGEEKTKSILFSSKHKVKKCKPLNIHYKNIKIKQYSKVTYLGCILDETLSGESMAIHVINKINSRLRFLYRQNRYLSFPLRRLLCNAMIQPFFDYACNAWYPNINKKLKTRLQAAQNKCIRFCLKLDDRFRLKSKEFERINWLPVQERISQCAVCNVYKFFSKHSPDYFEELFFPTEQTAIRTRSSFQKLKIPRRKTNIGLKSLSYTGPSLWNNLNENLKRSSSINDFKHKIKEFYFEEFKKTKHES